MKKLIIASVFLMTANLSAQISIQDSHFIDKRIKSTNHSAIELETKLIGMFEIDGHLFNNKTAKDPIIFKANLDGIKIYNSKKEYQKRKCNIDGCETIHLEPKLNGTLLINGWGTANKVLLSN